LSEEKEIKFSKDHEWLVLKGGIATMGISDFAQKQLGDRVSVELPKVGSAFKQREPLAIVDSVKASSDIYSVITGEVLEVNQKLLEHPELINESPHDLGWIVRIKPSNLEELKLLMSKDEYDSFVGESENRSQKRPE
jgi:glycine cleavage system H protein